MYDPRTGRWLIEDPIGFDGGEMDLYQYVGNTPTNAIDPTGLWEQYVIGKVAGPSEANAEDLFPPVTVSMPAYPPSAASSTTLRCTPQVIYSQVRGSWADIGSGTWGQPGSTADGEAIFQKNGDMDLTNTKVNSKYGGAASIVVVKGEGGAAGYCNTIETSGTRQNPNAGTLTASFRYFKPGVYEVTVDILYKLIQGNGNIGASVRVSVSNGERGLSNLKLQHEDSATHNKRGHRVIENSIRKKVRVVVGRDGTADIASVEPKIAGITGFGKVISEIYVADIRMVK